MASSKLRDYRDLSLESAAVATFYKRYRDHNPENKIHPSEFHRGFSIEQLVLGLTVTMRDYPELTAAPLSIETVTGYLQTEGLVSEIEYLQVLAGHKELDELDEMDRYFIKGCKTLDCRSPTFVMDVRRELVDGPVIGLFVACNDYDPTGGRTYLAEGDIVLNEEDLYRPVCRAVSVYGYKVVDGIPCWMYYDMDKIFHYDYCTERRMELDALVMIHALIV